MNSDGRWYLLAGCLAGGFTGILVMWNRQGSQAARENKWRRFAVLVLGTAAMGVALWAFAKSFDPSSPAFAPMAMIVMTEWAAVLQPFAPKLVPGAILQVGAGESAILRAPGTGVRLFGRFLRRTPLRRLGGSVYLSEARGDPLVVLRGVHDAEAVHLAALLFSCPWMLTWAIQGRWMSLILGVAVHLPLNIFPILHLRYVTWRIETHLARTRRHGGSQSHDFNPPSNSTPNQRDL